MRIVLATSGGGGHLVPALKVADVLSQNGHEVWFFGDFKNRRADVEGRGYRLVQISAVGWTDGSVWKKLRFVAQQLRAIVRVIPPLLKPRAEVVVGFGGYSSVPTVLAARCLRIPCMLHEQNVVPGKATLLLKRLVSRIAISFPQSEKAFGGQSTILTGCPSHMPDANFSEESVYRRLDLRRDKRILLVMGGSQGSEAINRAVLEAFSVMSPADRDEWQVVHATGERQETEIRAAYKALAIPAHVGAFLKRMQDIYPVVDVMISRAGAVTMSEIIRFQKKAVLIPYPHAGQHQKMNAEVLSGRKTVTIMAESEVTGPRLAEAIGRLAVTRDAADDLLQEIPFHSAEAIARIVETMGKPAKQHHSGSYEP